MNENQLKYILLSCVLLGIVMKRNFNKYYIYLNRKINLESISNNYYLSSDEIQRHREKIDNNLKLEHYDNTVMKNVKLFLNNYTKEELLILKKNIQTLKINNDKSNIRFLMGSYDLETNTILSDEESFNHEMHHVASTLGLVNGVMVSGFMQDKVVDGNSQGIGIGLNESYTEHLSSNQINSHKIYYQRNVNLIPLIELFFDNKLDLRKSYFNADLEFVINRFALISSKEDSIALIKDIDRLLFYDSYRTWFDKADIIDTSIRLRLSDYYERLTGNINCKDIFLPEYMVDNLNKAKKLIL